MSDYQVQMASIIISSLKGVTSYQHDDTTATNNFQVITPCSLSWMLVLNLAIPESKSNSPGPQGLLIHTASRSYEFWLD